MIPLNVEWSDTIADLKKKYEYVEGILVNRQRLIFDRQQLHDDRTIADYNIQENSIIYYTPRYYSTVLLLDPCQEYNHPLLFLFKHLSFTLFFFIEMYNDYLWRMIFSNRSNRFWFQF
jgi:hypothetical protein